VAHRRARLTPFGRLLLVARVEEGWSVAATAESMGISRATAHKWLRRFREEGPVGLEDRSSAPHRSPHALPAREVRRIVAARRRLKRGPHQLSPVLGHPRSTIYAVLRRQGLSRLTFMDRPTAIPIRYERERPGELVHIDVKKLGRVPAGGGHKMRGRAAARPNHRGDTTTSTSPSTTARGGLTSRYTPTSAARHVRGSCAAPPSSSPR
jgi:transposase-like protein